MKRRGRTAVKTRHTKRVKRKGNDAPLIAHRDNPRAADLKNQVSPLTRELLEAGEAEQHSSVQFAILVQSIKDYAIYMLDKAGRITSWNSGAERIKGYTRDEIIGQHFSRFYTDFDRKSDFQQKPFVKRRLTASLREKDGGFAKTGVNFGQPL